MAILGKLRGWKRVAVITLGGVVVLLALAAWLLPIFLRPHLPTAAEVSAQEKAKAALTGPAATYASTCAYCHDTGIGPRLAGLNLPPAVIISFARQGPGAMPAFRPTQISDAELAALAAYISAMPAPAGPSQ